MSYSARFVSPPARSILAALTSLSFSQHPELLLLLQHHLSPLLLKTLSKRSGFPLTLRGTRVVFPLLKQFSAELATEAEILLTLLMMRRRLVRLCQGG